MATCSRDLDCIICLDSVEKGIVLHCCAPKQGEVKIICNPCAAGLHIHYLKTKIENEGFCPRCPYCRTLFNIEVLDNIQKIYLQHYTDDQRVEIDDLLFKLQRSPSLERQSVIQELEIQRVAADRERQQVISELERYYMKAKRNIIIENYNSTKEMHRSFKEERQKKYMDVLLCTTQKTSFRQDKRCYNEFRDMVKKNPNIFPKKSYRKSNEYDAFDAFGAFDAFDAVDAFESLYSFIL